MKTNHLYPIHESRLNTLWLRLLLLVSLIVGSTFSAQAASITFQVLATFDYPGAQYTTPFGINDANDVAGEFVPDAFHFGGFIRFGDGSFSDPIYDPNDNKQATYLTGINNFGVTCGDYYRSARLGYFGFVRSADGTFTPFDVGTFSTFMGGINDAGNLCGEYYGGGWVSIDGTVTTFTIPKSRSSGASGINNLNQCVGSFSTRSGEHGFLRNADGTLVYPIDASNATSTYLFGINDRGDMVGETVDATGIHGGFLTGRNNASFDYPGAVQTSFNAINSKRVIVGDYIDSDGIQHAFLVRAKVTTTE